MPAWLWNTLKRMLFRLDAEEVHHSMVRLIRLSAGLGEFPLRLASSSSAFAGKPEKQPEVFGLEFLSRVGLAAGFDKDAEIVAALPALGFGFAEIGTVTPLPQPGNDRPRLFRRPSEQALFNRMGFNGIGAQLVAARLAEARAKLANNPRAQGFRIGVNIGKNKVTALEDAASDYAKAAAPFEGLVDYLVINVSSPNTPGLRSLQTEEALKPIVESVMHVVGGWKMTSGRRTPVLLKLAPEIEGEELAQLMAAAETWGIGGWVFTNTLAGTWPREGNASLTGGWSGGPLRERAREILKQARSQTRLPIISVGGIMDLEEAVTRRRLGADLVQIFSGWIYRGPRFPAQIGSELMKFDREWKV